MEYLLTGFSPAVDAFAFSNSGWSIDEDEAAVILDVVRKAALAGLAIRPPLVDAVLDTLLMGGPFLAIPEVQELLVKWLAGYDKLDAARPAFCSGMCFCALDAYGARQPSSRGAPGRRPTHQGTPVEAALRKQLLERHLAAWRQGAARIAIETKLIQQTQGVAAVRKRAARDVARLVSALRNDQPTPILVHQDKADPFSSHCVVAYGAVVHPPAGDAQVIDFYVYNPNAPVTRIGGDAGTVAGWQGESTLTVTLGGGLAAPTAVRALALSSAAGWKLNGLSLTPYAPAAPAPALVESGATAAIALGNITAAFHIANVGSGEIGPFVVGARMTTVTAAPGTRDNWPEVTVRDPRVGGGVRPQDGPSTTYDTVVIRVPPTATVVDRSPNAPQTVAPGTSAGAEVTCKGSADVVRLDPTLTFLWRSRIADLHDQAAASPWRRTYERRAPGPGVVVRPPRS